MPVKMNPPSVIKLRLGINQDGKVQRFATHTCRIHMDKYVPYKTGHLSRDAVEEGANYVKYDSPYAHYMYEGILYVDPETKSSWARKGVKKVPTSKSLKYNTSGHPYAGKHWDKLMLSAEREELIKEIQKYIGGK